MSSTTNKGALRLTPKLKIWLELKGWDQRDLAIELGCDESLISQWYRANNPKQISSAHLKKLCRLTGLNVGDLMTYDRKTDQED